MEALKKVEQAKADADKKSAPCSSDESAAGVGDELQAGAVELESIPENSSEITAADACAEEEPALLPDIPDLPEEMLGAEDAALEELELTLDLPEPKPTEKEKPWLEQREAKAVLELTPPAPIKEPVISVDSPKDDSVKRNKVGIELDIKPAGIKPPPGARPMIKTAPKSRQLFMGILLLSALSIFGGGYIYLDTMLNNPDGDFIVTLPWSEPVIQPLPVEELPIIDPLEEQQQQPEAAVDLASRLDAIKQHSAGSAKQDSPVALAPAVSKPSVSSLTPASVIDQANKALASAVVEAQKVALAVTSFGSSGLARLNTTELPPKREPDAQAQEHVKPMTSEPAVAKASIQISRKKRASNQYQLLVRAFAAYQAGDLISAQKNYLEMLRHAPGNRDALLGLAAIAQHSSNTGRARAYYQKLLTINPADSVAISGLIALQNGRDAVQSESNIKMLLDSEPEAAHLHFALGTQYVNQSRWAEAQQSFFLAHSYDPDNANYMLNLAISLDHLGQGDAALQYYRKALEASDSQQTGFNASAVLKRIDVLAARKKRS